MKSLSILLYAAAAFAEPARVKLPPPNHTPSATNPPKVVPQPNGTQLKVPAGFQVEEFASGFQKPRFLLPLATGAVLVTDSVAKGTVTAILPGRTKKELIAGLDRPFGMALQKGYLYVAEPESIKRYPFDVKTLVVGIGKEIISYKGYGKGHWTRSLAFDKKGEKLYVGVGSGSNVDTGDPENRAAVNVYNADGSGHEILATGLRNPVSLRFQPGTARLWATVQERDALGDDLVPDFFTEVKRGAFYGWPYAYIGPNEEPRHKGKAPDQVAKTIEPDVVLQAHASAMDFLFYTGKLFPAKYRSGAFVAYRGSSNRSKRVGYAIMFVPFEGGKPSGEPEEFLSGFMLGADQREVWGRPVGLAQLKDGSLLVSEDGNNKIYRVRYRK